MRSTTLVRIGRATTPDTPRSVITIAQAEVQVDTLSAIHRGTPPTHPLGAARLALRPAGERPSSIASRSVNLRAALSPSSASSQRRTKSIRLLDQLGFLVMTILLA